MAKQDTLRTIPFDRSDDIVAAIRNHESFEVGGCQGRIKEAVLFVERAIGGEGMTSRVYTKGRLATLAPAMFMPGVAAVAAIGMAAHNIATLNPDYEVVKRPIDGALRLLYIKDEPSLGRKTLDAATSAGTAVAGTARKVSSSVADAAAPRLDAASKQVSDLAQTAATSMKGMNPWAVAGGCVLGVGAIAAVPFTGGGSVVGAASLATSLTGAGGVAAATGGAGAAIGGMFSKRSGKTANEAAYTAGKEDGAAAMAAMVKEMEDRVVRAADKYGAQNKLNEFIICLTAIGAAMAACDGAIHADERLHLKEFVAGASQHAMPADLAEAMERIVDNPPPFEQAVAYLDRLDPAAWPVVDSVLSVVSEADGIISEAEEEFLDKWASYKAAHVPALEAV